VIDVGFTLQTTFGFEGSQVPVEGAIAGDAACLATGACSRAWLEDDMHIDRRAFLKGSAGVGAAVGVGLFDLSEARAEMRELKIARTTETRSVCPYCAVGCGTIIHTLGDKAKNVTPAVVHVEGDPDHPTNRGTLCPKGATLRDDINNPHRLTVPKVRRPGSDRWARWSTAHRGSRSSVAAPTPTSSTGSRTRSWSPGASSIETVKHEYDTAQRWPVWPPRSVGVR
jgi:hypothetical protein